ncbi:hypothetical protein [Spiroplasma endosymbiont of Stenodema calcarata]
MAVYKVWVKVKIIIIGVYETTANWSTARVDNSTDVVPLELCRGKFNL